eukprot:3900169-Pleurochrysis_carterae.AAC.1
MDSTGVLPTPLHLFFHSFLDICKGPITLLGYALKTRHKTCADPLTSKLFNSLPKCTTDAIRIGETRLQTCSRHSSESNAGIDSDDCSNCRMT